MPRKKPTKKQAKKIILEGKEKVKLGIIPLEPAAGSIAAMTGRLAARRMAGAAKKAHESFKMTRKVKQAVGGARAATSRIKGTVKTGPLPPNRAGTSPRLQSDLGAKFKMNKFREAQQQNFKLKQTAKSLPKPKVTTKLDKGAVAVAGASAVAGATLLGKKSRKSKKKPVVLTAPKARKPRPRK